MWDIIQGLVQIFCSVVTMRHIFLFWQGRIMSRQEAKDLKAHNTIGALEMVDRVIEKQQQIERDNRPPLSWASKQILHAYQRLPKESQTYGDIEDTLRALDTKHDPGALNRHFYLGPDEWPGATAPWRGGNSWIGHLEGSTVDPHSGQDRRHRHKNCIGAEHYALWKAVMDVKKAINEKEKAIELAGIEHELGQVPTLLEALKIEAEANRP